MSWFELFESFFNQLFGKTVFFMSKFFYCPCRLLFSLHLLPKQPFFDKIRLVFSIRENIPFKRQFEEENSHVILLRIDSGFTIDNIAGLYCPFKIEINVRLKFS
jgi:hypothetical protein